ncbi:aldo/keto reductase [Lentzea sp. BCCO 10_0061]|uniref:Aldo/keto reductase n=1 Tax=Lentzea sokolovensis TaxID=3095429 RepID=A0ABU4VA47_9PSEU|nr:aldo/keto reductase [Lentzea sp. BCCO 10_0061]MDX8148673.1 aldo/keto reductase [Lentzea sp. BCCO 10_0061]
MTVLLPSGETVPALGMGTWMMAEDPSRRAAEIDALRTGLDLGLSLVDTAEMYGSGASETLVGEALAGRRDEVFLVSKVLPSHASAAGTVRACEASLRRLGTDRLDLYLLHWRGSVPFAQTLDGFAALLDAGKIRHWGVSNLDLDDMRELTALPGFCQTNQILYNLTRRGPEHDLLPWHVSAGIPIMAYSPVEQGRLLDSPALASVARRHDATPAQVALAWVLRQPQVCAIPKAGSASHVRENARALELRLTPEDLADLDRAFPPPAGPTPLAML